MRTSAKRQCTGTIATRDDLSSMQSTLPHQSHAGGIGLEMHRSSVSRCIGTTGHPSNAPQSPHIDLSLAAAYVSEGAIGGKSNEAIPGSLTEAHTTKSEVV